LEKGIFFQIKWMGVQAQSWITEGFGRDGKLELRNFLGIAKGSCNELKSQLFRARDKDLITSAQFTVLAEKCEKEIGKLGAFIAYLNRTEYQGIKFKRNHSQQKNKPPEPAI